ncbi:MAG: AmmeMemoRadiSam system protein B [Candidatus Polarisedimenticolia bacterium]
MVRAPAVAGSFYPGEPETLRREVTRLCGAGNGAGEGPAAIALVAPHAGYVYSGRIAAAAYTGARLPDRYVILCPNHTGTGEAVAVMDEGEWQTPLGASPIDTDLARAVIRGCRHARVDARAHRREHALEVQLPFLQVLRPGFRFVPICVGTLHLPVLLDLGRAIAEAVRGAGGPVLTVISTDLSHYIPAPAAGIQDRKAIERLVAVDPEGLHRVVLEEAINMCGVAPAVAGLEAARRLGARAGRLLAYGHSGEASGDFGSVVGYAALLVA